MRLILKNYRQLVKLSGIFPNYHQNLVKTKILFPSTNQRFYANNPDWGSKKKHRNIKIQQLLLDNMTDPNIETILEPLRSAVKEQVSI
jgi:hypothetical protein